LFGSIARNNSNRPVGHLSPADHMELVCDGYDNSGSVYALHGASKFARQRIATARGERPDNTDAGHIDRRPRGHARAWHDWSICRPNCAFDRLAVACGLDTRQAEKHGRGRVGLANSDILQFSHDLLVVSTNRSYIVTINRGRARTFAAALIEGRLLETILKAERGVASCGGGSQPFAPGGPGSRPPGIRPGCEELAARIRVMPVTEARPRVKNRHGGAPRGERPASWDARRLARRLACRVMCTPNGCLARTRTFLGAPPTPRFGVSEARLQTPGAKTRRGNGMGCLKSE